MRFQFCGNFTLQWRDKSVITSQITDNSINYPKACSRRTAPKYQSSTLQALCRWNAAVTTSTEGHRGTVMHYWSSVRGILTFCFMMASSNGNISRVTGPLCGELIGNQWTPLTKASDAEPWYFLLSSPEQTVGQTIKTPVIWDAIALIMMSL